MTKEQYDKATEINKEIQKYEDLIARIKQGAFYEESRGLHSRRETEEKRRRP